MNTSLWMSHKIDISVKFVTILVEILTLVSVVEMFSVNLVWIMSRKLQMRPQAPYITYACPICRADEKEFVTFPNKQLDREVKSFCVMCTNKERGCEGQGELNNINNHLGNSDGCQFEDIKCYNECGKMLQ